MLNTNNDIQYLYNKLINFLDENYQHASNLNELKKFIEQLTSIPVSHSSNILYVVHFYFLRKKAEIIQDGEALIHNFLEKKDNVLVAQPLIDMMVYNGFLGNFHVRSIVRLTWTDQNINWFSAALHNMLLLLPASISDNGKTVAVFKERVKLLSFEKLIYLISISNFFLKKLEKDIYIQCNSLLFDLLFTLVTSEDTSEIEGARNFFKKNMTLPYQDIFLFINTIEIERRGLLLIQLIKNPHFLALNLYESYDKCQLLRKAITALYAFNLEDSLWKLFLPTLNETHFWRAVTFIADIFSRYDKTSELSSINAWMDKTQQEDARQRQKEKNISTFRYIYQALFETISTEPILMYQVKQQFQLDAIALWLCTPSCEIRMLDVRRGALDEAHAMLEKKIIETALANIGEDFSAKKRLLDARRELVDEIREISTTSEMLLTFCQQTVALMLITKDGYIGIYDRREHVIAWSQERYLRFDIANILRKNNFCFTEIDRILNQKKPVYLSKSTIFNLISCFFQKSTRESFNYFKDLFHLHSPLIRWQQTEGPLNRLKKQPVCTGSQGYECR